MTLYCMWGEFCDIVVIMFGYDVCKVNWHNFDLLGGDGDGYFAWPSLINTNKTGSLSILITNSVSQQFCLLCLDIMQSLHVERTMA